MKTATEQGSADLQQCFKCPSPSTYILRPVLDTCQVCPPGLACQGDATLTPVVAGSMWARDNDMFRLKSCPFGYYVFPMGIVILDTVTASQQKCMPCDKGYECTNTSCVTCSPCEPGYYKAAVSTDACVPCPANTYREGTGATDIANCVSCLSKSSTAGLTGQRSWRSCLCDSNQYRLVANTASDACIACPSGLICRGEGPVDAVVPNSTWVAEGAFYKLQGCPKGYYVFPMASQAWILSLQHSRSASSAARARSAPTRHA